MSPYFDASDLVKRYIQEKASQVVNAWIEASDIVLTGSISWVEWVEVATTIARAGWMKLITS